MRRVSFAGLLRVIGVATGLALTGFAHESPVDHVDRTLTLWVHEDRIFLLVRLQLTLRMALLQFHEADTNRDGRVDAAELAGTLETGGERLRRLVRVEVAGRSVAWDRSVRAALEPGLAQRFLLSAPLGQATKEKWEARLYDEFAGQYPGHYRFPNSGDLPEGARRVVAEFAPEAEREAGAGRRGVVVKLTLEPRP